MLRQLVFWFAFGLLNFQFAGAGYAEGPDAYQPDGSPFPPDFELSLSSHQLNELKKGNCEAVADLEVDRYDDRDRFVVDRYFKKMVTSVNW